MFALFFFGRKFLCALRVGKHHDWIRQTKLVKKNSMYPTWGDKNDSQFDEDADFLKVLTFVGSWSTLSPTIMVSWKITLNERKPILEGPVRFPLPWLWEEGYVFLHDQAFSVYFTLNGDSPISLFGRIPKRAPKHLHSSNMAMGNLGVP